MVNYKLVQICGYQNSGKTTLVNKLVHFLAKQENRVFTIKHHGHGGKPNVIEQKDSSSHIENGAIGSIVEGDGRLLLQLEKEENSIDSQLKLASFYEPNWVIIEGHKTENFPKVVLIRNKDDLKLLEILSNIQLIVILNEELKNYIDEQITIYTRDQEECIIRHILDNF